MAADGPCLPAGALLTSFGSRGQGGTSHDPDRNQEAMGKSHGFFVFAVDGIRKKRKVENWKKYKDEGGKAMEQIKVMLND